MRLAIYGLNLRVCRGNDTWQGGGSGEGASAWLIAAREAVDAVKLELTPLKVLPRYSFPALELSLLLEL